MMPKTVCPGFAVVAAAAALLQLATPARAASLAEALAAYRSNRVTEAENLLTVVARDSSASAADRASAWRELGRIDGLVRGETDAIATAMAQTVDSDEACATAAVALRVYRDAGQPSVPLDYAEAARGYCPADDAEALAIQRARSLLAIAITAGAARDETLAAAAAQLDAVAPMARGVPDVAGTRFAVAMARRHAGDAFTAWRDYYWLTDADAPQALASYRGRVLSLFNAGLAAGAADADVLALVELLVCAGFSAEAREVADAARLAVRAADDPRWRKLDAFLLFDATIRATALRANREMAAGGQAEWFGDETGAAMARLMQATGAKGDPRVVLAEHFGIYGSLGKTGGYPSLHAGHLVQRERTGVSQYGRSGEVEFIVIDRMLANGYESWLWDGWAEAGGWSSTDGTIVQVRSAYTDGPLGALRRTRPGPMRERFIVETARAAADERRATGRDGVAQLVATSSRLEQQVYDQISARTNDDEAFIAEVWRATKQYSIDAHEGRHALDSVAQPDLASADLEFRAKLSQIIFADYPRLGLASVAGQVMDDTPHGVGNRRVLTGYRRWMRAHRIEITGFDRRQPTLSQLHLLTDAQITAAARSMDPWAEEAKGDGGR
jgi:hypothetical protein